LLDVREPSEHVVAHIEGATLIPLGELPSRLGELPSGTRILVHCKLGGRSAKAVALLQENGFADVWNVAGGIMAWSNEIDSGVPIY
jgi:adenylyltransferase/sulfurtransferase